MAGLLDGPWLAGLIVAACLVSTWSLFNAMLLYLSRLPCVMAGDGWLPTIFGTASPTTAAPKAAIVALCVIAGLLAIFPFNGLAVIQGLLYTAALALEFAALVVFRRRRPGAPRHFRIPYGRWGLIYVCGAPLVAGAAVVFATVRDWRSFPGGLVVVAAVVAAVVVSGAVLYVTQRPRAASLKAADVGATTGPRLP